MKALVLTGQKKLEIQDIPKPTLISEGMLTSVEAVSICNSTDYRIYAAPDPTAVWPNQKWPFVLGHEICGRIVEIGSQVKGWKIGERIVGWCPPYGGFAEYCQVYPDWMASIHVPEKWPAEETCILELAIGSCRSLVDSKGKTLINSNSKVLVVGLGPSGQFYTQFARLMSAATIICIGRHEQRRRLALELGADKVFDSDDQPYDKILQSIGKVDLLIDTSGADLRKEFYKILHPGSMMVTFGVGFDWTRELQELSKRQITISAGNREEAMFAANMITDWINSGKLKLAPLISHIITLEDIPKVLEDMKKNPNNYMKVVAKIK
ncbi:MAG: hypothetical protein A2Y12_20575 [Planctomycetes bacterium GWF2_42_9]|nr:MAG: hypothetical protein A2Y12_20575 [Planctomycetes bacterium GWF2_42_9]